MPSLFLLTPGTRVGLQSRALRIEIPARDDAAAVDRVLPLVEIDPDEDRLVAYKVCAACARQIETAGCMVCSEKAVAYVF